MVSKHIHTFGGFRYFFHEGIISFIFLHLYLWHNSPFGATEGSLFLTVVPTNQFNRYLYDILLGLLRNVGAVASAITRQHPQVWFTWFCYCFRGCFWFARRLTCSDFDSHCVSLSCHMGTMFYFNKKKLEVRINSYLQPPSRE